MTAVSRPSTTEPTIKSVNEFASRVYRRARDSGSGFAALTSAIRDLQKALGYLHTEVLDPDSLLNQPSSASHEGRGDVYAREVGSLVEDSDFTLKKVDTILERYATPPGDGGPAGYSGQPKREVDVQERDSRIEVAQKELASQKTRINMVLDTIQLHNPARNRQALENTSDHDLDSIKDKLDAVAGRVFRERTSPVTPHSDDLWQEFKRELEKEGFSSEKLHKNKVSDDVHLLREYPKLTRHRRYFVPISANSSPTNAPIMDLHPRFAACLPTVLPFHNT